MGAAYVCVKQAAWRMLAGNIPLLSPLLKAAMEHALTAYLLAGASDDITTKEQVFAARDLLGTPKEKITKKLVPGGHIGLFMGSRTLVEEWPLIAAWMKENGGA